MKYLVSDCYIFSKKFIKRINFFEAMQESMTEFKKKITSDSLYIRHFHVKRTLRDFSVFVSRYHSLPSPFVVI